MSGSPLQSDIDFKFNNLDFSLVRNSRTKAMLELLLLDQIETNGVSLSDVCALEFYPGSILVRAQVMQNATATLSALINTGNLRLTVGGNLSVANLTGTVPLQ